MTDSPASGSTPAFADAGSLTWSVTRPWLTSGRCLASHIEGLSFQYSGIEPPGPSSSRRSSSANILFF